MVIVTVLYNLNKTIIVKSGFLSSDNDFSTFQPIHCEWLGKFDLNSLISYNVLINKTVRPFYPPPVTRLPIEAVFLERE